MKPSIYTLGDLIETFKDHSIKSDAQQKKWIEDFKKNSPDTPLPSHMKDDFNLPRALGFMCSKLEDIEKRLNEIEEWMKWAEKELEE